VVDVPMDAHYGDETSHLDVRRAVIEFAAKHLRNFGKRVSYNYFLRDLSIASLELVAAVLLIGFALAFGGYHWLLSIQSGTPATVGTVMLPALAMVSGLQFLLAFLAYDIGTMPRRALHPLLSASRRRLETRR
jgi:sterol desaturase/sphingolipid hydroxylase (fatty acid hydroxylase superfamily)